jgi:hypothetical protein
MWKDCVLSKKSFIFALLFKKNILNIKDNETYVPTIETQESKQTRV